MFCESCGHSSLQQLTSVVMGPGFSPGRRVEVVARALLRPAIRNNAIPIDERLRLKSKLSSRIKLICPVQSL
jgi:hypothetical protein